MQCYSPSGPSHLSMQEMPTEKWNWLTRISNDNSQNVIAVEEQWLIMDIEYHFFFQDKNFLEFD